MLNLKQERSRRMKTDVTDEYDSIISKLDDRIEDHQGMRRAIQSLMKIQEGKEL